MLLNRNTSHYMYIGIVKDNSEILTHAQAETFYFIHNKYIIFKRKRNTSLIQRALDVKNEA